MTETADILVIGAGIAGASAAALLAERARVVVLEAESQPGYHATGRSAALYTQTYGPPVIRALTMASRAAFDGLPGEGLADHPVLSPRGVLIVGRTDQEAAVDRAYGEARALVGSVERLDAAATLARAPMLRPENAAASVWEPDALDMDVHAIHSACLRRLRASGGRIVTDAAAERLTFAGGVWRAETRAGAFEAPVVVNAAGAWADAVAALAGLAPLALTPKRRTALTFDPVLDGAAVDPRDWPMVIDVDETFYFKPDAGRVLASPADATPQPPVDAQPDEYDVAVTLDRIETATRFTIRRPSSTWAGLRTIAPDGVPVVGLDPRAEGFFWLAGQGGYGIQTAPAMARLAAALAAGEAVPGDLDALGVTAVALSPARLAA